MAGRADAGTGPAARPGAAEAAPEHGDPARSADRIARAEARAADAEARLRTVEAERDALARQLADAHLAADATVARLEAAHARELERRAAAEDARLAAVAAERTESGADGAVAGGVPRGTRR